MVERDEAELIEQARAGQLAAFNTLVLRYQDYVYTICYRIMGDADSAADAAQDAFLTAFRRFSTFHDGNLKGWLARVATNTCYDELRRQKRRPQDYLEDLSADDAGDEAPVPADLPSPEQEAQRADLNRALQECISALSEDQRVVLVMSDIEGFAYQEIADSTGSSLGTIKSRLSRARLSIRRCLQAVQELLPAEYRFRE
jgi:RNA polymerase sigma factor (sigma-70 family)